MDYSFYTLDDILIAKPLTSHGRQKGWHQKPENAVGLWLVAAPIIQTISMPVSIDLVWFNRHFEVRKIINCAKPNRFYFANSWQCLELPEGMAQQLGLEEGMMLKIPTA